MNTFPAIGLFALLLKGGWGTRFLLVYDDNYSNQYDLASMVLGEEPNAEHVQIVLRKYFEKVIVTSIEKVDVSELRSDERSFIDSPLYICNLSLAIARKIETMDRALVFHMKKKTELPTPVSNRANIVFHKSFVQSRLT